MEKIRKVLSFDVGIINLAYCILEINDTNKTFKILKWGIINLADNRQTCNFIMNTGAICDKIAKHRVIIDEHNRYYFCKAHVNKAELSIRNINVRWWNVLPEDVEQCVHCQKSGEVYSNILSGQYCRIHQKKAMIENKLFCATKKCNEPVTFGLYLAEPLVHNETGEDYGEVTHKFNHGWCTHHYDDEYQLLLKKKTKKMPQNSNDISINHLGASMYKYLDLMPEFLQVDDVLVENQPTHINPHMKSVSSMLYAYFIMRGIHEKDKTGSTIKNINFCSPSNKIKVGGTDAGKRIDNAEDDKVYKATKELGVKLCKALISDNDEWLAIIESHKKQDDMADAFLQAIIMNFGSKLPEHYAKKIREVDMNIHQKQELNVDYEIKCKIKSNDVDVTEDALLNDVDVNKCINNTKIPVKRKVKSKPPVKRSVKSMSESSINNNILETDNNIDENSEITIKIGRIKNNTKTIKSTKPAFRRGVKRYYKKSASN